MPAYAPAVRPLKTVHEVCQRVQHLVTINAPFKTEQRRIRDIWDGGPAGIRAVVGRTGQADLNMLDLPTGNPIMSAGTHLSQKLQTVPDLRVVPPKDTDAARKHAEERELIVSDLDEHGGLEAQMPQVGLWLPGYGFAVWVITERWDAEGQPYPHAELRDPMEAHPGDWGVDQQPEDIAFTRMIDPKFLMREYPEHAETLLRDRRGPGGAVLLGNGGLPSSEQSGWSTQSQGIQIVEYYDRDGCWWVVPDKNLLLEYRPNPLKGRPQFEIAKRYSFNKLQGQYHHVIGLLAMHAKLSLMQAQFIQDNVHAPWMVYGQAPVGGLRLGRHAVNELDPNTKVERPVSQMPFQAFQAVDRIERQLRTTARYPVTDDGQSPNSFVTGAGLEELGSTMSLEVREYQMVIRRAIESLDSKRLEWIDRSYRDTKRNLVGERKGQAYAVTYKPSVTIAGNYKTRRKYGFMAGWQESAKLVGGLQLVAGKIIPKAVMRENLDGLDESLTRVEELIRSEDAHETLTQILLSGQPMDDRVIRYLISQLPAGSERRALEDIFFPPEEEMAAEPVAPELPAEPPGLEEAMAMMGGGGDTSSLARLTAGGNVGGGVQVQQEF